MRGGGVRWRRGRDMILCSTVLCSSKDIMGVASPVPRAGRETSTNYLPSLRRPGAQSCNLTRLRPDQYSGYSERSNIESHFNPAVME